MQKLVFLSFILIVSINHNAKAQWIDKAKEILQKTINKNKPTTKTDSTVTQEEAGQGIKQALNQGVTQAIKFLNKTDGFFGNAIYKLLLPPDAQKIANTLKKIGLSKQVDDAILSINRAAEDAVGYASPIFVNAIKELSITDVFNIIKGPKNAATNYFREKTTSSLKQAFLPSIQTSLDKVGATKNYGKIVTKYNSLPFVKKVDPDLADYVADKAIFALFDQVEKEEINIRQNPLARTTDLLKKVFGSL